MRKLARRPLTLALSLLMLSVLGVYGLGLTHGHRASTAPLGSARLLLHNLCASQHTVCGQMVPGVLSATLLIGMARARDGLSATDAASTDDQASRIAVPAATHAAPATETLLGLVALVVACCWLAFSPRITRMVVAAHTLPTRSIAAHLCTPAP